MFYFTMLDIFIAMTWQKITLPYTLRLSTFGSEQVSGYNHLPDYKNNLEQGEEEQGVFIIFIFGEFFESKLKEKISIKKLYL